MATNTTATATTHTGNGSTTNFAISFSFLANNEVDVTVAGVLKTLDTHYTISGSTVTFTSGNIPASGAAVKFQRDTNISTKKVDFQDGSVLTETDLDTNSDQVLFAQQEITDKLNGIEEGATADQTNAEIRAAVEAATDSNVFTDADHSKLNAIEASATADQTAAEIRTLVESASDSNVFTDADHTKLNGIEASATADQTAAEIRTLVESASDSNVFTDADHTKLNAIEAGATADQTVSEIKSLIAGSPLDASHLAANSVDSSELVDGSIDHSHLSNDCVDGDNIADNSIGAEHLQANSVDSSELVDGSIDTSHLSADCVDGTKIADNAIGSEHLAANSVGTSEIADAELTTLAGMQSGTASKLADSTALTADLADLNQLDGMAKQTTLTDDDTKFPTSGAVVDYVAAQIAPIGGLEVIANEDSFPSTQPSSGVVISISDIEGLVVNGSGVATNARTSGNGSDNVTINGFPSSLQSKTMAAGLGLMVSSTGSSQTYTYHKLLAKEADVEQLSNDINDFASRYRVVSSNPTSDNDAGDLIFNTSTQKLLVYNATSGAYEEAQSVGNFFISTLSPAFNGSVQDFTITDAPTNAQQIILSINGVVQKPNSGTSTPSEGFALSGSTVKLSAAPPSGSDYFAIVLGSTVNIGTPSDNTVTSAILQNGSVIQSKLADQAVNEAKLQVSNAPTNGYFLSAQSGNTGGLTWAQVTTDLVGDTSPQLGGDLDSNGNNITLGDSGSGSDDRLTFGSGQDLQIYHDGSHSRIVDEGTGRLSIQSNDFRIENVASSELMAKFVEDGQVELYYDNSKKFETTSSGVTLRGTEHRFEGTIRPNNATGSDIGTTSDRIRDIFVYNDIDIKDNGKLLLGDGDDLQIYHDGTHSYIQESGTGALKLSGDDIRLVNVAGNNIIKANGDVAELFHSGSKKFETSSTGVSITGGAVATGNSAQFRAVESGGATVKIQCGGSEGYIGTQTNHKISFVTNVDGGSNGGRKWEISGAGHFIPYANDTYDIGSSSYRVRNIYTNDLNLSNEGSSNDVDGTWGSYTIQEGAEDLFLVNKRNGKKYKFNLTEVS